MLLPLACAERTVRRYKLKLAEQQAALDVQAAEAAARERERFEKERVPLPMDAKGRAILPPPWKCTRCGFNNKAKTAVQITNCEFPGGSAAKLVYGE